MYQHGQRWLASGVIEAIAQNLRRILQFSTGGTRSRRRCSTAAGAGYDGAKRRKGSKVHMAVDTLGHLLSLHVTAASGQGREQVGKLAKALQEQTGKSVELVRVDRGYPGDRAAEAAGEQKIELAVVKLPDAKRGFVLMPRRWVAERGFASLARFRRLAMEYERQASTLRGMRLAASAIDMLSRLANWSGSA